MKYAIEHLERRFRNYKTDPHLIELSKAIHNAHTFLVEGTPIKVSEEVIDVLRDCLASVDLGLENGTKEATPWRKRQLKRKSDLEEAIEFLS